MPVAVLENGTRPNARALRTLLADLGAMIGRERVKSPAVIIVGMVAARGLATDALVSLANAAEATA
jgi:uroporphyrin-III C-methyltransferase